MLINFEGIIALIRIMRASKIHLFLFLAVFMLAAKPFVGFHAVKQIREGKPIAIFTKAFTKRKVEYVEDSSYDVSVIQKRLANPPLVLSVLFSFFLTTLFPLRFRKARLVTAGILSGLYVSLFPEMHRYLLSGKLII